MRNCVVSCCYIHCGAVVFHKSVIKSVTHRNAQNTHMAAKMFHCRFQLPIVVVLRTARDTKANHWGWRVTTHGEGDAAEFSFEVRCSPATEKSVPVDAWRVREQFFAIQTPVDAKIFFEKFGPYQFENQNGRSEPLPIKFRSLIRQKEFFLDALKHPLNEWRRLTDETHKSTPDGKTRAFIENFSTWQPVPMELRFEPILIGVAISNGVQEAIRATIFLDKAKERKFDVCICGCDRAFERTRKDRLYYDPVECGNKQRQKDWRDRQPKPTLKKIRQSV